MERADFVDVVTSLVAAHGSAPALDFEITEGMMIGDLARNRGMLDAIRRLGVEIAIDDFGTGYSSLAYLAQLPVNALKIDRSFTISMTEAAESMTIVSTIISLAHSMNLKVVAEGVETEEQAKFLRLLKCDELQGYLVARPLAPTAAAAFVVANASDRLATTKT
jgi:EAL domain-containing protein (putative c-di-GMP-specific phosphodiesterase class I)